MLDIVIPTYNNTPVVCRCLKALELAAPRRHRLIVVDDGSDDPHRDQLANTLSTLAREVHLLTHTENRGFKEAILTAMRFSDVPYVLLLNDDTVPTLDFDLKLLEVIQADGRTRAVGPVSNHPTDLFQFRPELRGIALDGTGGPQQMLCRFERSQKTHGVSEVPFLTAMCLLLDRALFEHLGFFDGKYEHGYFEDLELCCRIRERGHRLMVHEGCFVYHVGHETYKRRAREDTHRIIMRNFALYEANWSHLPEHQELLRKMEYAGKEDPI